MEKYLTESHNTTKTKPQIEGIIVGKVIKIDKNEEVLVDYPGNTLGAICAQLTNSVKKALSHQTTGSNQKVLLAFENNDPSLPIIIDTLYSPIEDILNTHHSVELETSKPEDVTIDGKRMIFDAKEEIVLRCGKGSISLKKDGRVLIRGTSLLSRASKVNKVKGSSIKIN